MKWLEVAFNKGEVYRIPAVFIAKHRAEHYTRGEDYLEQGMNYKQCFDAEVDFAMKNNFELVDWAASNMDWVDVKDVAVLIERAESNLNAGWINAKKRIFVPEDKGDPE